MLSVFSVLQSEIDLAIRRTIPPGPGHRERKLFDLARELKAFDDLAGLPVEDLRPIIEQWHTLALPNIRTKPFIETWFDFKRAWGKVKFPKGSDPISGAFELAIKSEPPFVCKGYDSAEVINLVKLCRELQSTNGDKPFYLDCRTAGELLGVSHVQAWRWLRDLADEGILTLVSSGSKQKRKANEYKYVGD